MSPYRTPAERPKGPRWGATWRVRVYVRLCGLPELRFDREMKKRAAYWEQQAREVEKLKEELERLGRSHAVTLERDGLRVRWE